MIEKRIAPRSVAIVGLGPSRQDFISDIANGRCDVPWDEVWVMNSGIMTFNHDLGFLLDDLKYLETKHPQLIAAAKRSGKPFVTATAYPDYPQALPYPFDETLKMIGIPNFLCNSGPMSLAYGLWLGVKKFYLFGFDYTYPGSKISEFGGQALAFLMGMAGRFGAQVEISPMTSLLGNCHAKFRQTEQGIEMDFPYYGLAKNIPFYDGLVNCGENHG